MWVDEYLYYSQNASQFCFEEFKPRSCHMSQQSPFSTSHQSWQQRSLVHPAVQRLVTCQQRNLVHPAVQRLLTCQYTYKRITPTPVPLAFHPVTPCPTLTLFSGSMSLSPFLLHYTYSICGFSILDQVSFANSMS